MEKIQILEHNAVRVLTTKQLAEFYTTEPRTISDNFNRNQERFTEGKHFFILQGEEKRNFINQTLIADGSVKAEKFYLWTQRGCARHAKILSTDKAWDVFEELEDTYFRVQEAKPLTPGETLLQSAQMLVKLEREMAEQKTALKETQQQVDEIRKNPPLMSVRKTGRHCFAYFYENAVEVVPGNDISFSDIWSFYIRYMQKHFPDGVTVSTPTFRRYMVEMEHWEVKVGFGFGYRDTDIRKEAL